MNFRKNIFGNMLFTVLFILVLLPMLMVFVQIVCPGLKIENFNIANLARLLDVFKKPLWYKAFSNSFFLGLGTTLVGVVIATFFAYVRVRYKFPFAKLIDFTAWIILIVPSFILAQGWIFFSSGNGIASEWLYIPGLNKFIFSYPGLVFVMVLCKFPLAYITIKNVFEWYPDSLIQAARMNGASPLIVWTQVQGPLCFPAFLSAAMLIFMDTVGDYGMSSTITAAFPYPTLPYTIYAAITTVPARFDMAGILSFYLIMFIVMAMIIQNLAIGRRKFDFLHNDAVNVIPRRLGKIKTAFLSSVTVLFCTIALGIPFGSNVILSFSSAISVKRFAFTLDNYIEVLSQGSQLLYGLRNSLGIALCAAVFGLLVGFSISYTLTYSNYKGKKAIDSITLIAMAVPGVVLGIGYIFVWNQSWLIPFGLKLYGTPYILILASAAAAIPLTNRVLVAGMAKIPQDLMLAAQVQGAGLFKRIQTVLLPLLHTSSVSAVLAAFGGSVFNLAITSILFPPGFSTLPVYISDAYNDLEFGYSAAATIVGGAVIITILFTLEFLLNFRYKKRIVKISAHNELHERGAADGHIA